MFQESGLVKHALQPICGMCYKRGFHVIEQAIGVDSQSPEVQLSAIGKPKETARSKNRHGG